MPDDDLLLQLRALQARFAEETRERWDRDMPFTETLSDRWERARWLGFGEGASIYNLSYVYGDVRVGMHTWIGPFTLLDGTGGLEIGAYCSISAGVHIYTHDTVRWALSRGEIEPERAPVRIGDCTYVGSEVVIRKGVTIGDHCVIGAQAFVHEDIPPYTIVAGVPARRIGRVVQSEGELDLVYD